MEVARLLRHSDPAVTSSVYAGLDDASVKSLGAKLGAALAEPSPDSPMETPYVLIPFSSQAGH